MTETFALTVTGPDRAGLVDLLSSTLAEHGANWQDSRMARLAGQFAGIVLVSIPSDRAEALQVALRGLSEHGLTVIAAACDTDDITSEHRRIKLELVGQDHPGIVQEIAHALAQRGVSIVELETHCRSASWSGEAIFEAVAELTAPGDLATDQLREVLEGLANELMVDITLDEAAEN